MMNTYAYVHAGVVLEIIPPMLNDEGEAIPVEQRYSPEFCAALIDITDVTPQPDQNWTYANGKFKAPPPVVPPAE